MNIGSFFCQIFYHLNTRFYQEARFDWTIDNEGNFLRKMEQAEKDIKNLPEYVENVKLLSKESEIKPIINKSIGSDAGMIYFIQENFVFDYV